jgi:asparagine synthase (glutamine-hydrolysing)
MELAAAMPSEFKIRNGSKKWILKQLFEPRLPAGLVNRRKQGFELPIDRWLRGPLNEQVRTHVLNPEGPIAQFIDIASAHRLFESHCRGVGRHGQLIWSLLVFARWLDAWGKPQEGTTRRTSLQLNSVTDSRTHRIASRVV